MSKQQTCCGPIKNADEGVKFFKALGEKNRLQILGQLCQCEEGNNVKELTECCGVDFSVVSRHLSQMKDAGLLTSEKQGKETRYRVDSKKVAGFLRDLANFVESCNPPKPRRKP